jgi:hypothetical protein
MMTEARARDVDILYLCLVLSDTISNSSKETDRRYFLIANAVQQ